MLAATIVAGTVSASAQTQADLSQASLEELLNVRVVTPSRTSEGARTAPARVHVVTAAQIARRGYRSLMELLKDVPDIKVDLNVDQDYPTELTVQGVRGASRAIVMLDGIRIDSPTNEPLPILSNYPVHLARQVEIVLGPASALYGADAFSAVINIITREPAEASGIALTTVAGQDGLYDGAISYAASLKRGTTITAGGQWHSDQEPDLAKSYPADFGNLSGQRTGVFNSIFGPMTSRRQTSPDFQTPQVAHSLQAVFRSGGLSLRLFESRIRESNSIGYTSDNAVYNRDAFQGNQLLVVAGSYDHHLGPFAATTTVSGSRQELDRQSGYWNVYSNFTKSFKYAYGSQLRAEEQLSWKPGPAHTVTLGASASRSFAIPQGADLNAPVASRDQPGTILDTTLVDPFYKVRDVDAGVYAQLQSRLTDAIGITLGARTDYNSRYGGTFTPRVGLVATPTHNTTLKALVGAAYLAPSAYETYGHYGSFFTTDGGQTYASNYWHLPNPDLKPQHKTMAEFSVRQTVVRNVSVTGSGFVSWFTNLIKTFDVDQAGPGTYLGWPVDYIDFPVNEGDERVYGGTFEVTWATRPRSDLSVVSAAALSLVDGTSGGEDDYPGVRAPIAGMSPVRFVASSDIDWRQWSAAPRLVAVDQQRTGVTIDANGPTVRRIPGYAVLDLTVTRQRVLRGADFFLTIENAADQRYRHANLRAYDNAEELIGVPQNPRRLALGLSIHFK